MLVYTNKIKFKLKYARTHMTSFELFRLLKFNKIYVIYLFFLYFFSSDILWVTLHYFMKNIQIHGKITGIKIKLCKKKAVEKKKWAGLKNLICINFTCLYLQFGF